MFISNLGIVAFGAALLQLMLSPCASIADETVTPFQRFQQFLVDRPVISELVFATKNDIAASLQKDFKRELEQSQAPPGRRVPEESKSEPNIMFARWEKDAWLMRGGCSLEDFRNNVRSGVFYGVNKERLWQMNGPVQTEHETDNPEAATVRQIVGVLFQTMHFGIPMLQEGTLQWHGTNFTGKSLENRDISGFVVLGPGEVVLSALTKIEGQKWDYLNEYEYGPNGIWPARILTSIKRSAKAEPEAVLKTEIYSLQTSTTKLSEELIDPRLALTTKDSIFLVVSNNVKYRELSNGSRINVATISSGASKYVYLRYSLFTALSLVSLLLFRWARNNAKVKQQRKV